MLSCAVSIRYGLEDTTMKRIVLVYVRLNGVTKISHTK